MIEQCSIFEQGRMGIERHGNTCRPRKASHDKILVATSSGEVPRMLAMTL